MAQADGTVLMDLPCKYVGPFKRQIILIGQTAAADNGVWIDASDLLYGNIEIAGTATTFSFQLYGSNAEAQPTVFLGTDTPIGTAISTVGFVAYTGPHRWVNLRLASVSGGNIQAIMQALTQ